MIEPAWLSYTGTITGIIGAIAGIAGAIMGYVAYRRSGKMKSLDLRLELRKSENELRNTVEELPALLDKAKVSRTAVFSATGRLGSGALQKWSSEWEADLAAIRLLGVELPHGNSDYAFCSQSELEEKLVASHAASIKAVRFRDKYISEIAADDKDRENIQADRRIFTQAKLEGKK